DRLLVDLDLDLALAAVERSELALVPGLAGVALADLRRRHEWPPSVLCSHREKWAARERQRTGRVASGAGSGEGAPANGPVASGASSGERRRGGAGQPGAPSNRLRAVGSGRSSSGCVRRT